MLRTNAAGELVLGNVKAVGTENCGLPVEYWVDRAMARIIRISNDPLYPSPVKDQACARFYLTTALSGRNIAKILDI